MLNIQIETEIGHASGKTAGCLPIVSLAVSSQASPHPKVFLGKRLKLKLFPLAGK